MRILSLFTLALLASPVAAQPKPKSLPPELVAPTDALSPADERKAFTLPPSFDAQLVASEPDIQKPMQMAFDAKGRMWVTTSFHYPFAAPLGKGTDKLFVLSDFDPATGKAKKVQTFASDLNIPIGILPLPDCNSCIVSSCTEIRKYTDTDGDGKADKNEVLFSGFGYRDTHGMYNSYTLMPDGWVYACHGFNNDSTVKGKDGHEVKMHSGNTFRFRPDGSRIEVYSRGQVNPFGMTVDPWFNLYTADCHSKPMTQIIPGAYYESFGKPHDGLGFGPVMIGYEPGGTGMCGLQWYDAEQFPKEYKGNMFLGNVVTNRVHMAKIEWHGATPKAVQQPDLISSSDRWFRPVDIKLGPDGALYVADFYNKIIGHYEVPLNYPGRDHDHGRIWRVVWKGKDGKSELPKFPGDFTKATEPELLSDLFHPNLTVRFLAGHQLRHRVVEGNYEPASDTILPKMLQDKDRASSVAGWFLFLMEAGKQPVSLDNYENTVKVVKDPKHGFKAEHLSGHVVRALNSRAKWGDGERKILLDIFKSFDSVHQKRAAVEAVIMHPHADFVQPVLDVLKNAAADDTHLKHAARIALRNCLRDDAKAWPKIEDLRKLDLDPVYAEIALAIPTEKSAELLLALLRTRKLPSTVNVGTVSEHIARYTPVVGLERVTDNFVQGRRPIAVDELLGLFRGLQARGKRITLGNSREVLEGAGDEILRLDADKPEDIKRLAGIIRVLSALPAITAEWKEIETPEIAKRLGTFVTNRKVPMDVRSATADAFLNVMPNAAFTSLRPIVTDSTAPPELRDRLLVVFAGSSNKEARLDARDALKDAPYRTAVAVGVALAGTPTGAEDLLNAVKIGKAPARLLQEKAILERLRAANIPDLDKQVAALTKGLPALDQRLADLIKKRSAVFASSKPDKELGAKLFTKHCAACHKIGEMGGKIAPQLDGIGLRGLERLLEDTLDPNRNVDQAFRARVITTKDEKTITGLMLRVEGEVLVIADGEGKEVRIPTKDIETNRETMLSPMPANVGDIIPEADFMHLIAYLLDQKAKEPPKEK